MFILFAERKVGEQHGPAAQGVLAAVQTLREMNADNLRKVPADAPTAFIKPRWKPLVITPEGLDRRFYEICALSELKNALRSGDIWVKGSRQFRDFDDYLLLAEKFAALKREQALPLAINPNSDQYLEERLQLLDEQLATVTRLAKDNELPDAILTESGLKITPLDAAVPDRAQALIDQTSQLLPRIKITELLMDVDDWTGFSRHFTHLKDGAEAKDRTLLLSAILGDAINLGLTKMAESMSFSEDDCTNQRDMKPAVHTAPDSPISGLLCTKLVYAQYSCAPKRGEHGDRYRTDCRARRSHPVRTGMGACSLPRGDHWAVGAVGDGRA